MSLRPIFSKTVTELSNLDSRIVTIVGDISHGIFKDLRANHPSRYFNIGICEPSMLSVAAGLSAQGLIPVVHTITPFLIERSYEQIKLDFAYQNLGGNLVSVGGSFEYSKLGCTHHCYSDFSLLSKLPNTQIFFPGSENEFKTLFESNYANGKLNYFRLTEFPHQVNISGTLSSNSGVTLTLGSDITIVVCGGPTLKRAFSAAEVLMEEGVSVEILYFHTLKPFDETLVINSIVKTKKFLVIEELYGGDGLYSIILNAIGGKIEFQSSSLAVNDFIRDYGTYQHLTQFAGLSENRIIDEARNLLTKGN